MASSTFMNPLGVDHKIAEPLQDHEQSSKLWNAHLEGIRQGKVFYFLPNTVFTAMKAAGRSIEDVAEGLMRRLSTPVYVHYNIDTEVYRIGQVIDQDDLFSTQPLIFIYMADPNNSQTARQLVTSPPPAIPSMAAGSQAISQFATSTETFPQSAINNTFIKPKVKKVPKPSNSWILYRKSKHYSVVAQNPGMHNSEISTIIGSMWRNEEPSVKDYWQSAAENEKRIHALRNPGHKITPRKSSAIKRRKTKKVTTVEVSGPLSAIVHSETSFPDNITYFQPKNLDSLPMNHDERSLLPSETTDKELEHFFTGLDNDFEFQFGEIDAKMNDIFSPFGEDSAIV